MRDFLNFDIGCRHNWLPVALFDRNDIDKSFSRTIVVRGADYLRTGQVEEAWWDPTGKLCGIVQGSEAEPYEVGISFTSRAGFVDLDSTCTCPYSFQCKHAVALALYALKHEIGFEDKQGDGNSVGTAQGDLGNLKLWSPPAAQDLPEIPLTTDIKAWLDSLSRAAVNDKEAGGVAGVRVFYVLRARTIAGVPNIPTVAIYTRSVLKTGAYGVWSEVKYSGWTSNYKGKGWTFLDCDLIHDLNANAAKIEYSKAEFRLDGKHGARLLPEILATGRCSLDQGAILRLGDTRPGEVGWSADGKHGSLRPHVSDGRSSLILTMTPPFYLDASMSECGPLDCGIPAAVAAKFTGGGPISAEHVSAVREKLEALGLQGAALPTPVLTPIIRVPEPVPCLKIDFEECQKVRDYWNPNPISAPIAFAKLTFEYEGLLAPADGSDVRVVDGGELVILRRHTAAEEAAKDFLDRCGWDETKYCGWQIPVERSNLLCMVPPDATRLLEPLERIAAFSNSVVPKLIASGWKVDLNQSYRFVPDKEVEWNVGFDGGSGIDWFEFQLGIVVEGKPYDLRPVLASLFREFGNSAYPTGPIARTRKSDDLFLFGIEGQVIRLSRERLGTILQPLVEIFGGAADWPKEFRLPKSLLHETDSFADVLDEVGVPWKSSAELSKLRTQFAKFDHLEPMSEPIGFVGELRGYQREGLAWLQFLREYGFSGILADDMGLGKTVQLLAHILAEKQSGRMDSPCLIVAPTSTIPNWRKECERFAPELKVVTLQGSGRQTRFGEIKDVDIALTTYPLLARDKGSLMNSTYHVIVLDEAQNIKNYSTGAARSARELKGNHKICMSGTPVENHLGELWSLFQFLMPGFLGTDAEFKSKFRTPIEKLNDRDARDRLARRIRPFMLRRTKAQVVKELPPKTEVIESIAFEEQQRDLYESIRVSMDEQVRNLIAAQGFDKSRFQILDALLKLRQVCCDPRLVKLPSARNVHESAKLNRLMEMLRELLEDGRRVLLFSQFTSMLDLIEERLTADNISWLRISGDTIDRETPVARFQAGEVPLFLISLKAGGTGLNLTAADTVILYDPWWNPAVENQAIDRAHRIGQDKAVIVYKLVASGTIEEKMLEMQARKGDIARGILTEDAESIRTLTADDLKWVLSKDE